MKKNEIRVGGLYLAKVSGVVTTVRVDAINQLLGHGSTRYHVTNLRTGRRTTFRSAAKFRGPADLVKVQEVVEIEREMEEAHNANPGIHPVPTSLASDSVPSEASPDAAKPEGEHNADPTTAAPATPAAETGVRSTESEKPSSAGTPASAGVTSTSGSLGLGLAGRIAAANAKRQAGSPVAGMVPNEEQEAILAAASDLGAGQVLVAVAGAGAGKTATCKMLEQVLKGNGQYTAFNRPLVDEARGKFVKARVSTTHGLAFGAVGKQFQHRLPRKGGPARMRSAQIAIMLGIEDFTVILKGQGEPEVDADGKPTGKNADKVKVLSAEFLAGQVLAGIRRFSQSADRVPGTAHLRAISGMEPAESDKVKEYLAPFMTKAWTDLTDPNGRLPYAHDYYVKQWQLGEGDNRPIIAADYILLDEYQDTAPVFLDILVQQTHALLVMVGDDNQRIYAWRGAVNAGDYFPDAPRCMLSQSYRFGQAIADVANTILATLEEPTKLRMKGHPGIPSRVGPVAQPKCYLYRTNAGAIGRFMAERQAGRRPCLLANADEVIDFCDAAARLQNGQPTDHPDLGCFDTWQEVETYSKTDEGADLALMVKLVKTFGAQAIRDALKDMPKEAQAGVVISTAHKSKGREWKTVRLGNDFPTKNKMGDEDRRLLYVAATRAQEELDLTECPPFCGGYSGRDTGNAEDDGWVPGLQITYSQPQPTAEALAAYRAGKAIPAATPPVAAPSAPVGQSPTNASPNAAQANVGPANGIGAGTPAGRDEYSWASVGGGQWGIRGPKDVAVGSRVKVVRRNGTSSIEVIRTVLRRYNDAWVYGT